MNIKTTAESLFNALHNAKRFKGTDPVLPVLYGVHITTRRGHLVAEATDRYMIGQVLIEKDYEGKPVDLIISNDGLSQILYQFSRKGDRLGDVTIEQGEASNTIWVHQEYPGLKKSFEVTTHEAEYPDIDLIVQDGKNNASKEQAVKTAVNPRLLRAVAGIKDHRTKLGEPGVYIQPGDGNKPVFFAHMDHDGEAWVQGVLMPLRDQHLPDLKTF